MEMKMVEGWRIEYFINICINETTEDIEGFDESSHSLRRLREKSLSLLRGSRNSSLD